MPITMVISWLHAVFKSLGYVYVVRVANIHPCVFYEFSKEYITNVPADAADAAVIDRGEEEEEAVVVVPLGQR